MSQRALFCYMALVLSCDLQDIIMTWVVTHAALKYVRQTCSISEVVSHQGVRRAAAASHRLSAVVALGLCSDVELVLHIAVGRPAQAFGSRHAPFVYAVRLKLYRLATGS